MTHPVLPVDGNLTVFLEEQAVRSTNIELFGRIPAESHLAGFLFGLRRGFGKDEGCEIARKRNLGKFEGFQHEIGTAGKLEFLPDNGIKGHVGPKSPEDRHVLYEFA